MSNFFTAPDGADEPTIWKELPDGKGPAPVARRAEMPHPWGDLLWRVLTGVLCADDDTVAHIGRAIHNTACTWEPTGCAWDQDGRDCDLQQFVTFSRAVLAALRGEQ